MKFDPDKYVPSSKKEREKCEDCRNAQRLVDWLDRYYYDLPTILQKQAV